MRAGALRYPIVFYDPSKTDDTYGAPLTSGPKDLEGALPFLECWADIRPMRAQESDQFRQNLSEVFHEVRIRYFEGLHPGMVIWVQNDGRYLSVLGVMDPDGRRREMRVSAKEVPSWTGSKLA